MNSAESLEGPNKEVTSVWSLGRERTEGRSGSKCRQKGFLLGDFRCVGRVEGS